MAIFSQDSPFMKFMDRLVDVFLLNLLWIFTSLPLVTIGASTTAAFSVCLKMVDEHDSHLVRSYFKAFKANFKPATLLWLLQAAAIYALWLDWQMLAASSEPSPVLLTVGIVSVVFVFCIFIYAWPQMARYENTLRNMCINSVRISFRFFVRTLILALVLGLEIALFTWNVPMMVAGALVGPMILVYTVSGISRGIFRILDADPKA